jgi:hypothetical protein
MAHKLKLDIYCFSIKMRGVREAEYVELGDFFREKFIHETENPLVLEKEKYYQRFIQEFVNSFHNEFVLNKDETKGIATDFIKLNPSRNIVDGMINGGLTGIDQNVYDRKKPEKSEDTIEKDKITALPYYFKLWTPFDSTVGVLMIQSYTDMGVNTLVIDQLKKFFSEKDYTLEKYKHVPREYKENFKRNSKIFKVTFIKLGLSNKARKSLNPVFAEHEGLKVKLEFTGFNESPENFWKKFKGEKIINTDLTALEMVEDDDFETIASYKDEYGFQSSAKISKNLDILPTYFLSDILKVEGKDYPDYEKVRKHTNEILETVKIEIGYTPEYVD